MQKGDNKTVAVYWYQSHGRTVANEYRAKFYVMSDAIRYNRTDTALVRVMVPVVGGQQKAAEQAALQFVKDVYGPLSEILPGFTAPTNYFGIFIPKGVPDDVIATVQKIWIENISKSDAVKKYAVSRGALFAPAYGDAAQKAVFPAVQANAWLLFDTGKAKVSPDTVGIAKP